jgi:DNA-directed RNA polymerase III subunit RPC1
MDFISKKLQFSLLNPQDTVKLSEYEVTHRDLYTATDRAPVKNGVLDRRLVRNELFLIQLC